MNSVTPSITPRRMIGQKDTRGLDGKSTRQASRKSAPEPGADELFSIEINGKMACLWRKSVITNECERSQWVQKDFWRNE